MRELERCIARQVRRSACTFVHLYIRRGLELASSARKSFVLSAPSTIAQNISRMTRSFQLIRLVVSTSSRTLPLLSSCAAMRVARANQICHSIARDSPSNSIEPCALTLGQVYKFDAGHAGHCAALNNTNNGKHSSSILLNAADMRRRVINARVDFSSRVLELFK